MSKTHAFLEYLYGRNFLKRFATTIEGNPEKSGICDRSAAAAAE